MIAVFHFGYADQFSLVREDPGMERAHEFARIALVVAAHPHAAMAAIVEKDVQLAIAIAVHDHGFFRHPTQDVVPVLRDLTFVTDK